MDRYLDRIEPWVHYVPIQLDLSDLLDTLYFFRGDPAGNNGHPDLAEKIAHQGREWSLTHWRKEDLTAYMFRLMLEYARVMNMDRDNEYEVELDADLEIQEGKKAPLRPHKRDGKVRVYVGMHDYVYNEDDEYLPGKEGMPWDWRYRDTE